MLSLTFYNIVFIIVVSVHGIPSPQSSDRSPDTGSGGIIVPSYRTYPGSDRTAPSSDPGGVVVPTIPNSQGSGGNPSSSDSDTSSSNGDNYRQNAYHSDGTPRQRTGSRQQYAYQPATSTTSGSNVIIQSSQTCSISQAGPEKGVDKIGSSCTSFGVGLTQILSGYKNSNVQ